MPHTTPLGEFDLSRPDSGLSVLLQEDHDRPPLGTFVFGPAYDGTCFIIKNHRLHYCRPKEPEHWPALFFIEVSTPQFPGVTGLFHNGQPYYFTAIEIYYIQGTGNGTFLPITMKAKTGAQSIRGAISVDGKGVFHTGPDGIYLFANGTDRKITEETLEPIFRGEDKNGLPGVSTMSTSWLDVFRNHLYFGYQDADHDYPTNVLVMNLNDNRVVHFTYNDGSDIEIRTTCVDKQNKRLLIGDNTGFIRVVEAPALTADSSEPIVWQVQSKDYNLGIRRNFPRWAKYDVDASSAEEVTGEVVLDDETLHSHTITGNRVTKRRLVEVDNGNRVALRLSGGGPVTIYGVELE